MQLLLFTMVAFYATNVCMNKSPIEIYRHKNGMSLEDFGRLISPSVDKSTVLRWQRKVPAERIAEISIATGIPREDLRPDLFDDAQVSA